MRVAVIGSGTSLAGAPVPENTTALLACCHRSLLPAVKSFAREHGIPLESAGDWLQADYVLALWNGFDGDTAMRIKQCLTLGIPHHVMMIE